MDNIQNNVKGQQVQNQKDMRFNINDSVWIAAAAMAYEIYYKKQNAGQPIYVPDTSFFGFFGIISKMPQFQLRKTCS